jgi:hypothetical protein
MATSGMAVHSMKAESRYCGTKSANWRHYAMKWLIAILLLSLPAPALAQLSGADFCQGPQPAKSSAPINCSGTGSCLVVGAGSANQVIQVCGLAFDLGGSSPTAQFVQGVQTTTPCDTATKVLTGAMTAGKTLSGPLDYLTVSGGNQLCLILGGTTPSAVGVITYVQK